MKSMKCAPINVAERDAGVAQHTPDGSRNPKRGNAPLSGGLCQQLGRVIAASFDYTGAARSRTGPEGLTRAAEDHPNAPVRIHRTRGSAVGGRQRFRQPDKELGPCLPWNNREGSRDGPPIRPRLAELGNSPSATTASTSPPAGNSRVRALERSTWARAPSVAESCTRSKCSGSWMLLLAVAAAALGKSLWDVWDV